MFKLITSLIVILTFTIAAGSLLVAAVSTGLVLLGFLTGWAGVLKLLGLALVSYVAFFVWSLVAVIIDR